MLKDENLADSRVTVALQYRHLSKQTFPLPLFSSFSSFSLNANTLPSSVCVLTLRLAFTNNTPDRQRFFLPISPLPHNTVPPQTHFLLQCLRSLHASSQRVRLRLAMDTVSFRPPPPPPDITVKTPAIGR